MDNVVMILSFNPLWLIVLHITLLCWFGKYFLPQISKIGPYKPRERKSMLTSYFYETCYTYEGFPLQFTKHFWFLIVPDNKKSNHHYPHWSPEFSRLYHYLLRKRTNSSETVILHQGCSLYESLTWIFACITSSLEKKSLRDNYPLLLSI